MLTLLIIISVGSLAVLLIIWTYLLLLFLFTPTVSKVIEKGPTEGIIAIRGKLIKLEKRPPTLNKEPYAYAIVDNKNPTINIPFASWVNLDKFVNDEIAIKIKRVRDHFVFHDFVHKLDLKYLIALLGLGTLLEVLLYHIEKRSKITSREISR